MLGLSSSRGRTELLPRFQIFQIPLLLMAMKLRRLGDDFFELRAVLIAEMTDSAHGFDENMLADPRFLSFSLSDHIRQTLVGIAILHNDVSNCTAE